jgi:hypothetical protein
MEDGVPTANVKRSQAILRIPVDLIDAAMILHDGERSDVLLFVPPGEELVTLLGGRGFIAVARGGSECLVARDAIACLAVAAAHAPDVNADLPAQHQAVIVKLRSGVAIEGELRFVAPPGQQRTTDHLNSDSAYLAVHSGETTHLIAKAHVAMVLEV